MKWDNGSVKQDDWTDSEKRVAKILFMKKANFNHLVDELQDVLLTSI
jgi:hypothetical protein